MKKLGEVDLKEAGEILAEASKSIEITRITTKEVLSRREQFAMAAMQGIAANCDYQDPEYLIKASIKLADELIKQLDGGE